MGVFEAVINELRFRCLQKPLVFFMTLACIIFLGLSTGYIAMQGFLAGKAVGPLFAMFGITFVFLGLCVVCGKFLKKSTQ